MGNGYLNLWDHWGCECPNPELRPAPQMPKPPSKAKAALMPGAELAVKCGCKCPVIDNHHGKGRRDNYKEYYISEDCVMHAPDLIYPDR